jgi:RalA-binding protein 1
VQLTFVYFAVVEECPIFGVSLDVATARHKCHDGIALPLVVRQCVDYIEENGLMQEGIYRVSGVKSKVNKLKAAFNCPKTRNSVALADYEPAVIASVLKLFLRELPDPVLTSALTPRFEQVSSDPTPRRRIEGMKTLVSELPDSNRLLVQWIFVHMMHVVERERFNKMTLQNVSIVLSPTMQISHRVLNCLFENSHILFDGIQIKR